MQASESVKPCRSSPLLPKGFEARRPTTRELGNTTSLNRLPFVTADAWRWSGRFRIGRRDHRPRAQPRVSAANFLAEALERGTWRTESAHRKIAFMPALMSRLMLLMDRNAWVRRRAIRLFEDKPGVFSKLLSVHTGALPVSSLSVGR